MKKNLKKSNHLGAIQHYEYLKQDPDDWSLDERPFEALLTKAVSDGYVRLFETGRGRDGWLDGYPCPELRALRRELSKEVARQRTQIVLDKKRDVELLAQYHRRVG